MDAHGGACPVTGIRDRPIRRTLAHRAVLCPRPVPEAAVRLFLFHHAGGSHLLYRDWAREFPDDWEVCLLVAPGRGRLRGEPLLDRSDELVDFFLDAILPWTGHPFAFFGHSMGALVAYELTRRLAESGPAVPRWLGLSACGSPVSRDADAVRAPWTDERLRDYLRSGGETPDALLEDRGLWRMFKPIFRSDFALIDSWRPDVNADPLTVPIAAFGGDDDPAVGPEQLAGWAFHTERFLGLHLYSGGHFYLNSYRGSVVRQIVASLSR